MIAERIGMCVMPKTTKRILPGFLSGRVPSFSTNVSIIYIKSQVEWNIWYCTENTCTNSQGLCPVNSQGSSLSKELSHDLYFHLSILQIKQSLLPVSQKPGIKGKEYHPFDWLVPTCHRIALIRLLNSTSMDWWQMCWVHPSFKKLALYSALFWSNTYVPSGYTIVNQNEVIQLIGEMEAQFRD